MVSIKNLHIENFRAIGELDYSPRQINIITGRNNTGKSTLLDAIYVNATGLLFDQFEDYGLYNIKNGETKATINSDINKLNLFRNLKELKKYNKELLKTIEKYIIERFLEDIEGDGQFKEKYLQLIFKYVDFLITTFDFGFGIISYFIDESAGGSSEFNKKLERIVISSDRNYQLDSSGNLKTPDIMMLTAPIRIKLIKYTDENIQHNFSQNSHEVHKLSHFNKLTWNIYDDKEIHQLEKFIKDNRLIKNITRLTQNNVLYDKNGEIETIPISAHGDGFIALLNTIRLLLKAQDGILLIEEPENHLHPRYLDVFIKTLYEYCPRLNVQVFMATHSYDLILSALEYPEDDKEKDLFLLSKMTSDKSKIIEKFDYTVDEGLKVINELYLDLRGN